MSVPNVVPGRNRCGGAERGVDQRGDRIEPRIELDVAGVRNRAKTSVLDVAVSADFGVGDHQVTSTRQASVQDLHEMASVRLTTRTGSAGVVVGPRCGLGSETYVTFL